MVTSARARAGWRLGRRGRGAVLLVHIASAGAWLGIDVVLGVVVGTALLTDDRQRGAVALQSLGLFAVWPLLVAGLVCLASGILLGLGSKYGLVRYWWVATKLALNVLLTSLVLLALRPGIAEVAAAARQALAEGTVPPAVGDMVFPPVVSTTLLLVAMTLSVFKPWGRIRSRRPPPAGAGMGSTDEGR
jgi:hypothetical protein